MQAVFPNVLFRLIAVASVLFSTSTVQADEPLKIFILAGQSNMVGHARAHTIATLYASDKPNDQHLIELVFGDDSQVSRAMLEAQLKRGREIDELTGGISNDKLKAMDDGDEKAALTKKLEEFKRQTESYKKSIMDACAISDRVYISSIADRNRKSGKLAIGYGGSEDKIGPEYAFGLSLAEQVEGPILLIKTSWGGKSLHYNFRPPSVGAYEPDEKEKAGGKLEEVKKNAGLNYQLMNDAVHKVLDDLGSYHPGYDPNAGYEIAGFVWFQGFNDQFSPEFRDNYKDNMIAFIKDVRKEYDVPDLPFVIGVLGTGVTAEKVGENPVSLAQRAAAEALGKANNVVAVESYTEYSMFSNQVFQQGWPEHYHEWDLVGSDRPYHYLGSGAFFVRLGDKFADAMVELLGEGKQ